MVYSVDSYLFLSLFVFLSGYLAFDPGRGNFFALNQASMDSYFDYFPWLFIVFVPATSMKFWAEEKRSRNIELLLTFPIKTFVVVLSKFFVNWGYVMFALVLTFPMIITVEYLGDPNYLLIFLGYLGAVLVAGAMLSCAGMLSALFKSQLSSFVLGLTGCLMVAMMASPPVLDLLQLANFGFLHDFFTRISFLNHYENFALGVVFLKDILFFVVVMVGMIIAETLIIQITKASY